MGGLVLAWIIDPVTARQIVRAMMGMGMKATDQDDAYPGYGDYPSIALNK